jgi:hypothetical protein
MLIKTAPANGMSIEELVAAVAILGIVRDRIKENGHEEPRFISDDFRACNRELQERLRADKERQLKVLESRLESLATVPEKRKKIGVQITKLKNELAR